MVITRFQLFTINFFKLLIIFFACLLWIFSFNDFFLKDLSQNNKYDLSLIENNNISYLNNEVIFNNVSYINIKTKSVDSIISLESLRHFNEIQEIKFILGDKYKNSYKCSIVQYNQINCFENNKEYNIFINPNNVFINEYSLFTIIENFNYFHSLEFIKAKEFNYFIDLFLFVLSVLSIFILLIYLLYTKLRRF